MASIRYLVPYQVDILAKDLTTGKRIGNTLYYMTRPQTVAPPAYGLPIAGLGDTATLLANIQAAWATLVSQVLSVKYETVSYTMRAILGYGYGTPTQPINALVQGPTFTTIQTAGPHGLATGDIVRVAGVTTPANVNGTWSVIVVTANQVQISPSGTGTWSSDGSMQRATGVQNYIYADTEFVASSDPGGVAGDALPIFVDADVRRLNPGVGKSFRSRIAMAPISEDDNLNGKLTAASLVIWAAQLAAFNVNQGNGGSDATSGFSFPAVVSKLKASVLGSPFPTNFGWTQYVSGMVVHANLGSQNNRKPKLAGS